MDTILAVSNLTKQFSVTRAVDSVSFAVKRGEMVGLLGANGAGKTTTIQMLVGITLPTSGKISYFGSDFSTHKSACLSRINYASAYNTLQGRISVWENLVVYAHLYNVTEYKTKINQLADFFGVTENLNRRLWDLSAGQKTRVNLVKALLNDPELILMDEPTASLDPDIADKTLQLIEKLKHEKNLSILYTSHNMDEVTRICDTVIFLEKGRVVAQDTPSNLTNRIKNAQVKIQFEGNREDVAITLNDVLCVFQFTTTHTVQISKIEEKDIPNVIFKLSKNNIWINDIEIKKPNLEDVFLQISRRGVL